MKVPIYEAIDKDTGIKYQGFYFEYPETTYCFREDYKNGKVKLISCLVIHTMSDWGLPNKPQLVENIDRESLKFIGYIETEKEFYDPGTYIK